MDPQQDPEPDPMQVIAPVTKAPAETLTRSFVWLSLRRAFRLNIQTDEVLPTKRAVLEAQATQLRNPEHQAFLAWRRSVLLLVALMFVPLTVFRFLETFDGPSIPHVGRAFQLLPAFAEAAFCIVAFDQLKNWAQWKKQRRILFIAWAIYFVAPFLVYAYPFRLAYDNYWQTAEDLQKLANVHLRVTRADFHFVIGMVFGMQALLVLGPKVVSLMPGMIRASIVSKLQFPGATAPGWLMMLAAPF